MNVVARVQTYCCPSCGGFIGEAAPIEQVRESITVPAQRIIFDLLSRSIGRAVHRNAIIELMYGGRSDGGPDTADHVVKAQVSQLRRRIEPFGWTISVSRGGSGHLAQWRLIPTEASA
ncbi:hypothetical protein [Rhizobium sp. S163]|uniref:hypothetical protein n=1 Tax=Rhizobium sp. S163 TaxID=3055039 RepID=UPI0025A979B3|nr:hypothetical protein [Rhizobium sp. S163]MDM9643859.1 hypothetical protein [Rhizobium sp. S163]